MKAQGLLKLHCRLFNTVMYLKGQKATLFSNTARIEKMKNINERPQNVTFSYPGIFCGKQFLDYVFL